MLNHLISFLVWTTCICVSLSTENWLLATQNIKRHTRTTLHRMKWRMKKKKRKIIEHLAISCLEFELLCFLHFFPIAYNKTLNCFPRLFCSFYLVCASIDFCIFHTQSTQFSIDESDRNSPSFYSYFFYNFFLFYISICCRHCVI